MYINCYIHIYIYIVPATQTLSLPSCRLYEDGYLLPKELFSHVGTFEGLWIIYWKICGAFIPKIHALQALITFQNHTLR